MAATKNNQATKKDTKKFTWRIENFSKLEPLKLDSDTFLAGGYKWRVLVHPKGNRKRDIVDHLSVYLEFADEETMPSGWSVPADFSFTLVGQLTGSSSVEMGCSHKFDKDNSNRGFRRFVPIGDLYLANDTLIIEAKVSTEEKPSSDVTSTDEPKVDSLAKSNGTISSSYLSPSTVQLTSRNLMAELSTMTASSNSSSLDGISCSIPGDGSSVLQQQREKLLGFLDMSLEALSQSKLLDDVENIAIEIFKQATDPLEKTVLNDLVSRLAEFKEVVPSSLSTIESCHDVESFVVQIIKELEVRLVHRNGQLTSLEAEICRLEEEGMKLEGEIQQLTARKAKILDHKNSTSAELDKANEEASKELDELKKQHGQRKEAVEKRMGAKDKLAQANASWKLFKENLGWQQQHQL